MRVCVLISTGQLLDSQSGDDAGLDVLIQNAVNAGYQASDVQAKVITDAEFQTLLQGMASTVPQTVSPRQARLALLGAGLLDKVQAAVTAAGGATEITWDYAIEFNRTDPFITALGQTLGLTDADIDSLFRTAATL